MDEIYLNYMFFFEFNVYKLDTKLFKPEYKMKELCGETGLPEFGDYSYIHKNDSKHELILFWIRNSITIFLKGSNILINSLIGNVN